MILSNMKRSHSDQRKSDNNREGMHSESENEWTRRKRQHSPPDEVEPLSMLSLVCDQTLSAETNPSEANTSESMKTIGRPQKVSPEKEEHHNWKNVCKPVPPQPRLPTVPAGFTYPLKRPKR
jgi:hypothetical protein